MIRAVMHPVMRVQIAWGIPLVRYWNSVVSKGRSREPKAGVRQRFVQIRVRRQPRSDNASPGEQTVTSAYIARNKRLPIPEILNWCLYIYI